MRPLVVVGGAIHPDAIGQLEAEARVVVADEATEEGMLRAARHAEAILFRIRPRATRTLLAACPRLRCVGRHGVGLDIVDLAAATDLGIAVVHAPGSNADSVAEHALMLILACAKKTLEIDRLTRAAEWGPTRWHGIMELKGKTLGIVGVGNIGRRVARMGAALGLRVLGYDKYVPADEVRARGAEPVESLEALLRAADIVTCHTPLTEETRHMIDGRAIALMKPGVIFINTSRGPVQDEAALLEALEGGKVRAAGLDVWEDEPVSSDNALLRRSNVVASSHVAGVTEEAYRAIGLQVTAEILRVLRGERPHVLGNPELWPKLAHLK
jgi:D-3-phosphoglycerate dehydrogenase / 2-oxoglutarate reductase